MDDFDVPITIVNGSKYIQTGFSCDDAPRAVFPTLYGRQQPLGYISMDHQWDWVGDEAQAKRGFYRFKLYNPIPHDYSPPNLNQMEKIWHHTFEKEVRVTPEEHPVIMTDFYRMSKSSQLKTTKIMFETFDVPFFYLSNSMALSLYASGKTTGIVVKSGHSSTRMCAFYEGNPLKHSLVYMQNPLKMEVEIAGNSVTEYLNEMLAKRGIKMETAAEKLIVGDIKEKLCYIAGDYEAEVEKYKTMNHCKCDYELPDGSKMNIGEERFKAPEILFKPSLIGKEYPGIHEYVRHCIRKCDIDLRGNLFKNILLSGGSTMYEGFVERLRYELNEIAPNAPVKICDPLDRKYSAFSGGSMLSMVSSFAKRWILKKDYEEWGPPVVRRMCPESIEYVEQEVLLIALKIDEDVNERIEFVVAGSELKKEIKLSIIDHSK